MVQQSCGLIGRAPMLAAILGSVAHGAWMRGPLKLGISSAVGGNSTHSGSAAGVHKANPPCECEPSNASWTPCKRRTSKCVFIDLGAASGNSFNAFLGNRYGPVDGCSNGWKAILVEANPRFNAQLHRIEGAFPGLVHVDASTAAYACEATTSFYLDTVNDAHDYWGSAMTPNNPNVHSSGYKHVTVPTVNLNRILFENTIPDDWVMLKMDIEGAEWDVLPCLAKSPTASLIDRFFLEEHTEQWGLNGTTRRDLELAKAVLKSKGVDMPPYFSNTLF